MCLDELEEEYFVFLCCYVWVSGCYCEFILYVVDAFYDLFALFGVDLWWFSENYHGLKNNNKKQKLTPSTSFG